MSMPVINNISKVLKAAAPIVASVLNNNNENVEVLNTPQKQNSTISVTINNYFYVSSPLEAKHAASTIEGQIVQSIIENKNRYNL